ncbi:glycosyltransferase family 2 protein [Microbulbifer sp. OS29]|uniref:Glycosyltransferase family 2 protein n=1 Tax=Microbulbifer okhotskensis TaxID=2926617 RepID=A0A9X2EQD8_9GAMM|nr:glycosyltransferase family A protein [Microbulbifer okhotskensis]MCO1336487.1 glycosyltransferase family 2 protein [Microbulbifer okhotskensis]
MTGCEVGVVIPTFNEKDNITNALTSIVLGNRTPVKVYLSDDNSTDTTVALTIDFLEKNKTHYQFFLNDNNKGAGYCRNRAFEQVIEPFTLFFDADDLIVPGMLDRALAVAKKINSELLLMAYQYSFPSSTINLGMAGDDDSIFYKARREVGNRLLSVFDFDSILCLTPYPWNRLIKTNYARSISLRFSETPVHNDVLAHWNLLVNAKKVAFLQTPFCIHHVNSAGSRLSNISDIRRTAVLQVFDDVERLFDKDIDIRDRFYHLYVEFKLTLFEWCLRKLDDEYKDDFKTRFVKTFSSLSKVDYRMLFERNSNVANAVLALRASIV